LGSQFSNPEHAALIPACHQERRYCVNVRAASILLQSLQPVAFADLFAYRLFLALLHVGALLPGDDKAMDTVSIDNRGDFGLWAIERAKEIIAVEASALAIASRDGKDEEIRDAANALGAAISAALLEVYDGLVPEE